MCVQVPVVKSILAHLLRHYIFIMVFYFEASDLLVRVWPKSRSQLFACCACGRSRVQLRMLANLCCVAVMSLASERIRSRPLAFFRLITTLALLGFSLQRRNCP